MFIKELETECFGGVDDQVAATQPHTQKHRKHDIGASVDFVSLIKIYSTRLLTNASDGDIGDDEADEDASVGERRVVFLLCALSDTSRLSEFRHRTLPKPTNNRSNKHPYYSHLKWMNYAEMQHAQREYQLMGLEPLAIYHLIKESMCVVRTTTTTTTTTKKL